MLKASPEQMLERKLGTDPAREEAAGDFPMDEIQCQEFPPDWAYRSASANEPDYGEENCLKHSKTFA